MKISVSVYFIFICKQKIVLWVVLTFLNISAWEVEILFSLSSSIKLPTLLLLAPLYQQNFFWISKFNLKVAAWPFTCVRNKINLNLFLVEAEEEVIEKYDKF